ncbi:MAG TPA: LytTR family DNA-binding domain-containing protein [Rubrivivax sp.]|nr:LytTR family DNA-binding domain-containing protein [Rubrivivax sp.]
MRVLLVDDEALARTRLRWLIDQGLPELGAQVVGEVADAEQALAWLHEEPVDLVLLDIQMPGRDGLRLAAALKALPRPPAVVFVTAHSDHALRAFELQATDYLTKPVMRERLRAALLRVRQQMRLLGEPAAEGPALVVSDRGRVLRLPIAQVLVLKAEQKYVTLRTAAHNHVLDDSLAELEPRLAELGGQFIRIHRNALVARHAIRELQLRGSSDAEDAGGEGWAVRVAPLDEWLAVSRRQVAAVWAALSVGA